MAIALNIGQGAGVAAALSAKKGLQPRGMDVGTIQDVLRSQGVSP